VTYQWQIGTTAGCDLGFSDIAGATSATYDAPALTAVAVTTYFRRVTTSTVNGVSCSANSNCLTVTPNAITPGVIAGDQTVCIGEEDPAAFTSTTAGTGGGDITYQWQSNTTGCDGDFANITGATSATFDPGVATVTTYYRRVATSTLNGVVCSANSNCLTVTTEDCGGHIFPTQTTCCNFVTETVTELVNVCTTIKGNNRVSNAVPGVFFYYSNVTAPLTLVNNSFTIDVKQTNDGDLDKLFVIQGFNSNPSKASLSQIRLTTDNCDAVTFTPSFILDGAGAHYVVTGATPGATYVVSIKYDTKSIIGAIYSGGDQSSTYTFASYINGLGTAASGSEGTINAVAGCSDNTPLPGNCSLPTANVISPAAPIETITAKTTSNAGFDAYPVPFKDQLTIKYKFDYKSDVKIEVFNAQGISVLTKTDTNSYFDKEITLDLKASKRQEQVYVVKVTTNRGSTTKKVMSSK
ncbi:T9SS type A sorting domain-containing protein, partial [Flavobacterium sp. LT1R49]|uniref:T9SS type A sorting domain-containing protein n=1 Tax=Flavobacterium arabinosi TaxID=3398737 RepID=UPI003A837B9A